jgi:miniconductance mechanosensitive channel
MSGIQEWFSNAFQAENLLHLGNKALQLLILLAVAWLSFRILHTIVKKWVGRFVKSTRINWDEYLHNKGFFKRICYLAPGAVIIFGAPLVFNSAHEAYALVTLITHLYLAIVGLSVVDSFISALHPIFGEFDFSKEIPIKGFLQVLKILAFIAGGIVILSLLVGQPPYFFLGGLGAMTAIIMLVFKDAILGLVAGIQLSANKMVALGDWIEMPEFGADGDVIDIALTTIKVRNWDKTITSVPTYALISSSFKNWRGMTESGGRRIMRSISLDQQTISFLTEEQIEALKRIGILLPYISEKEKELQRWNEEQGITDTSVPANGRRMTNVGTFRAYVKEYLYANPNIRKDMTFLVRQLEPTPKGLPIQIYVFTADTAWVNYEGIQADIFDHLLSVVPLFGLRVFQEPTGEDIRSLARAGTG